MYGSLIGCYWTIIIHLLVDRWDWSDTFVLEKVLHQIDVCLRLVIFVDIWVKSQCKHKYKYGIIRLPKVHRKCKRNQNNDSDQQRRGEEKGVFNLSVKSWSVESWQETRRNIWSCKIEMKWKSFSCALLYYF